MGIPWSDIPWSLLYLISEWTIRIVALPIVVRRRKPTSAMAWLLVIFLLPWVGLVVYLLIGENRLPVRRIREHLKMAPLIQRLGQFSAANPHVVHPRLDAASMTIVQLAERLGEKQILGGNRGDLITDTKELIQRLIDDIDAAEHHVHLLFYIFADDKTGQRVVAALARAVERGVKCRVLADHVGSWRMFRRLGPKMREQGIELHAMLPVNFFRRRLARMDLRNHRKLAVIDGRIAYSGSQNIVDASYGHKDLVWHDMSARLTGPIVLQLQGIFIEDWYYETSAVLDDDPFFPEPDITGQVMIQSLPSGPTYETENYQRLIAQALYAAQRHVIITSPYLVPDEAILQALQTAVLRGVRVDVIVPRRCDQVLVGAAARAYYHDLLEAGVNLYLNDNGLLHSKTMSVDDMLALVGTANFDIRSFYLNFELNLLGYGPDVAATLRYEQRRYMADSKLLTAQEWSHRGRIRDTLDHMAKLLSPLL